MDASLTAGGVDARHSTLSRTHRSSQAGLDSYLGGTRPRPTLARQGGGRFVVQELEAKTALTHCQINGNPWSLNPYAGCSHACAYCYVPDVTHVQRKRWGSYVAVKRNLPTVLARELKRKEMREVFLSSATDPYQPVEGAHRVTRRCLELLLRAGWPLRVLTRNPLVVRDLDLLTRFEAVSVGMSVPTLDEEARRAIEPGAPPVKARLATLRRLADAGLEPYVNLAPCFPLSGGVKPDDVARAMKEAGVAVAYWAPWRYMEGVRPALWRHLQGTPLESLSQAVETPGHMERLYRSLAGAFDRAGVPFERMDRAGRNARGPS